MTTPTTPSVDSASTNAARPPSSRRRRSIRALAILLGAYLLVLVMMFALENAIIFFPSVYPEGNWHPPGLAFEDAWFEAADGVKLHGWYLPHDQPRAVILFAHGNAGNLSDRAEFLAELVRRLRVSVMIFDYRGYGRSSGKPSEAGILADARAARAWLARRADVDDTQIVLLGESLGGAVMVDLAAADGARALVLENTFSSLPAVAAYHFRWLPVKLLMRTRLDSAGKIANYHGPLLQFHGDADTIVPFQFGQKLFAVANQPKQFVAIHGGDHNDPRRAEFYQALDRFLGDLPPKQD